MSDYWSLTSTTTYAETDYKTRTSFDTIPQNTSERRRDADVESYTQEIQLSYQEEDVRGSIGLFASYFDEDENFGGVVPVAILGLPIPPMFSADYQNLVIDADAPNEETNLALFSEWEYDVTSRWTIIAGGRFDYEKRKRRSDNDRFFEPNDPLGLATLNDAASAETDHFVFLPKAGLRYSLNEQVNFGLLVQRGYRSGGTDIDLGTGETNEFDPEFTWNIELSARAELAEQRGRIDANVFYTDWKDQQVGVISDGPLALQITDNAGESHLYGAEIDASLYLDSNRSWEVFASVGLLHTEFDDYIQPDGTDFSGDSFPLASELSASAGVSYQHNSGFFAAANVSYWSESNSTVDDIPGTDVGDDAIVNAQVGYEANSWLIKVYGTNILDHEYAVYENALGGVITPGNPAQFGVSGELYW